MTSAIVRTYAVLIHAHSDDTMLFRMMAIAIPPVPDISTMPQQGALRVGVSLPKVGNYIMIELQPTATRLSNEGT